MEFSIILSDWQLDISVCDKFIQCHLHKIFLSLFFSSFLSFGVVAIIIIMMLMMMMKMYSYMRMYVEFMHEKYVTYMIKKWNMKEAGEWKKRERNGIWSLLIIIIQGCTVVFLHPGQISWNWPQFGALRLAQNCPEQWKKFGGRGQNH